MAPLNIPVTVWCIKTASGMENQRNVQGTNTGTEGLKAIITQITFIQSVPRSKHTLSRL